MNKAWERALFGHTVKTPCSNAYLTRVSGERITKYLQTIESAHRRAATATSSRERAVQLGIVDEARAHLRELMPFMTKEQKRRAEKDSPF